jgi:hypothetical protein
MYGCDLTTTFMARHLRDAHKLPPPDSADAALMGKFLRSSEEDPERPMTEEEVGLFPGLQLSARKVNMQRVYFN